MAAHTDPHPSPPPGDGDQGGAETGRRLFDGIRRTGLVRPDTGWFGGVAALVAARLRWDTALVRGLLVVAIVLFFPPIALTYGLMWLLLPDACGRIPLQRAMHGDHSGGLFGAALLTGVGALTLLSPFSLTGAFGVVLNVLVLAALVWVVVSAVRRGRRSSGEAGGAADDEDVAAQRQTRPMPTRTDGRPAWYPTTAAPGPAEERRPHRYPETAGGRTEEVRAKASTAPAPTSKRSTAAERDGRRRRRLLSVGAVLLAVPALLGLLAVGATFGVSPMAAVLGCLIVLVLVMSSAHIVSAIRGRRGRGFLLGAATVVMVLLFSLGQGQGVRGESVHAFGPDTTDSTTMSSAFSSTIMDLRRLDPAEGETVDGVEVHHAEISTAFSSLELIVPDDVEVVVEANQAFGSMTAETVDGRHDGGGLSSRGFTVGPADADRRLHVSISAAFNSIEIFDATSYAQETGEARGSGEARR